MCMSGGVDPRDPAFDPGLDFLLPPRRDPFSPPLRPLPLLIDPLMDPGAVPGFELVEMTDSAGELALDSWAKLSRRATVSPSVKLEKKDVIGGPGWDFSHF